MANLVLILDSATQLGREHRGRVVIAGSHGGLYPAYLAAKASLLGVVFNDAGIGKDAAGIASLGYLERMGIPAATVSHLSARIADGADIARRGTVSHINAIAAALGCNPGDGARRAAELMLKAEPRSVRPPHYAEGRVLLQERAGEREVWGIDSAALMEASDIGRIMVTGSHGALLAGRPDHIVKGPPLAAFFNDASIGVDEAGVSRLAALDGMGVIGATVGAASARIGDARSSWETGVISRVNRKARNAGAREGDLLRAFIARIAAGVPQELGRR
jgi:hypothetical protein